MLRACCAVIVLYTSSSSSPFLPLAVAILLGVLEEIFLSPSMQLSTHKESLVSVRRWGVVGGGEEGGKVLVNKKLT